MYTDNRKFIVYTDNRKFTVYTANRKFNMYSIYVLHAGKQHASAHYKQALGDIHATDDQIIKELVGIVPNSSEFYMESYYGM